MESEIIIEFKGDHIHVRQYGRDNYDISLDLWKRIIADCEKHNCFNILGETYTHEELSTMDAYNHVEIFSLAGVSTKHRIAWVHQVDETKKAIEFTETVLLNRGRLNGGLFPNLEEAKRWLLETED